MIVNIVSRFNDKGVKQATRSFSQLVRSTLGVQLSMAGAAYAMQKMVRAAAEDERATASLARTLANAGWSKATEEVNAYIDATQRATGVADDELRPAFTSLFAALQDANAAMGAVNLSLDIARGTGKDTATVASALSKAYVGNRKSLLSLGTGIDKATLQTADLNTVMQLLASRYAGQAATAAETTAGKFDRLRIAGSEAAETIGGALIDAFGQLASGSAVNGAIEAIDNAAESIAAFIREASGVEKPRSLWSAFFYELGKGFASGPFAALAKVLSLKLPSTGFTFEKIDTSVISQRAADLRNQAALQARLAALQEEQAKAAAKAAAAEKAKAAAAAKALKLKQLAYKFDIQAANIAAAKARTSSTAIASRLDLLSLLNKDAAGLPVSDAELARAQQSTVNITINNAGSVITEAELTQSISAQLMAQRIRSGTVLGTPAEFRFFEQSTR